MNPAPPVTNIMLAHPFCSLPGAAKVLTFFYLIEKAGRKSNVSSCDRYKEVTGQEV